jgi:hypothetical protein
LPPNSGSILTVSYFLSVCFPYEKRLSYEQHTEGKKEKVRILPELGGCDFKALSTPTAAKCIALHYHQQLYCFLLSLRTLFMRKVYRRKEGNSKGAGGDGGL